MKEDQAWMALALEEAQKAFAMGEVPIGAVLVSQGKVIAKAHNLVESLKDPTAHAEVLCLRSAASVLDNWRVLGATLYCTLEPCMMCAGSMIQARIDRLVFGASEIRQGACGSLIDLLALPHPIHRVKVTPGVLAEESGMLLKTFFQARRKEKEEQQVRLEEMIVLQKKKVSSCAQSLLPHLTEEDLLQPNDFPELENHPYFRYEEGFLHGLLSVAAAKKCCDSP